MAPSEVLTEMSRFSIMHHSSISQDIIACYWLTYVMAALDRSSRTPVLIPTSPDRADSHDSSGEPNRQGTIVQDLNFTVECLPCRRDELLNATVPAHKYA